MDLKGVGATSTGLAASPSTVSKAPLVPDIISPAPIVPPTTMPAPMVSSATVAASEKPLVGVLAPRTEEAGAPEEVVVVSRTPSSLSPTSSTPGRRGVPLGFCRNQEVTALIFNLDL